MNTRNVLILAIIIIAVIAIAALAISMLNNQSQQNVLTQQGTKLNLQNNNNQLWQHMDIVIENLTINGTQKNFYFEAWVKPGENLTIDLSNAFGYGNKPLPNGTVIIAQTWSSLLNNTAGGTGNYSMTLNGWSYTAKPVTAPLYNVTMLNMPIGPLPTQVTTNLVYFNTTKASIDAYTAAHYPHDDVYEVLYTQINMTVNNNGDLIMIFQGPPTLCSTIAHIISA